MWGQSWTSPDGLDGLPESSEQSRVVKPELSQQQSFSRSVPPFDRSGTTSGRKLETGGGHARRATDSRRNTWQVSLGASLRWMTIRPFLPTRKHRLESYLQADNGGDVRQAMTAMANDWFRTARRRRLIALSCFGVGLVTILAVEWRDQVVVNERVAATMIAY